MKIIIYSGKAQHGKSTAAEFTKKCLEEQGKKVMIFNYADYLKFILTKYYGWDRQKDEKGRTLLQKVGTGYREKDPDFWVKHAKNLFDMVQDDFDYVVIGDARFKNEIEYVRKYFTTVAVRIKRPRFDNGLTKEQQKHVSEVDLDKFNFDEVIHNRSDIQKYEQLIETFVKNRLPVLERVAETRRTNVKE